MKKKDVNISEEVNINVRTLKKVKYNQTNKNIYKSIFFSPITKLDCVNSMDIYDDLLIYGTIMGNVILCHIDNNYLIPNKKLLNKEIKDNEDLNIKKNDVIITKYQNRNSSYINNEDSGDIKTEKCSNVLKMKKNKIEEKEEDDIIKKKIQNLKNDDTPPIPYPQTTNIISNSNENIPCVIFDTKDNVIISLGDYELMKIENISTFNAKDPKTNCTYQIIKNYDSKTLHFVNCENSLCFLTPTDFLLINMMIGDINSTSIRKDYINYIHKKIKNFSKPEIISGSFEANNYSVMFDFDGSKLLFVEYKTENQRRICIFDTLEKKIIFEYEITNDFGHISFMRFISQNKIFLVRKYIICEIYQIDSNSFILEETWEHIGEEILAVQIYFDGTKMTKEFIENDLNDKINNRELSHNDNSIDNDYKSISFHYNEYVDQTINNIRINKINAYNSSRGEFQPKKKKEITTNNWNLNDIEINKHYQKKIFSDEEMYVNIYNYNNKNKYLKKKENNLYSIATLDINGNFNLYKHKNNTVLFNLYNIEGIEQIYKEQEFFFLRYPYYISMNSKYICISTDHGIFVITKFGT